MEKLQFLPGAEPFYYAGIAKRKKIGCLMLHGFTGVPGDVRLLGKYLSEQGYTVLAPRLTHHGNEPADLNRSHWHDWYLSALDGWHLLQQMGCTQIVPVGLSMGGTTALLLSVQQPVKAVVSMAAPVFLFPDWRLRFTRLLAYFYPFVPKSSLPDDQKLPENEYERQSYEVNPTHGVAELLDYLDVVEAALQDVQVPAFIIHSRRDLTVPPSNLDFIYERLGTTRKEKLWLDESSHVVTESVEKEILFSAVADFIERQTELDVDEIVEKMPALTPDWRERWRERWGQAVGLLFQQEAKE